MIRSKEELENVLRAEFKVYFPNKLSYIRAFLLKERNYKIWKYQYNLRKLEYYKNGGGFLFNRFLFAYYSYKVNSIGNKIGIEAWQGVFSKGLHIYHIAGGIVANSNARVGSNCHLHGNNCIGNDGKNQGAPIIGNNCIMGVGAKVIGNIELGNDIVIAAGAVVIKTCLEDGVTLAGIPAKVVKKNIDYEM